MISPPGYGLDLDTLVAEALRDRDPNRTIEDINSFKRCSLLEVVAIDRRRDLVQYLLEAGATMTADGLSNVIWWWNGAEMVALLLKWGTPHHADCIHQAIRRGRWDIVFILLDSKEDISRKENKASPYRIDLDLLHMAVWQKQEYAVRHILERAPNVDERDAKQFTPLMNACRYHKRKLGYGVETVFWLLEYGANPNAVAPSGETSLLLCLGERLDYNYYDHRFDIAQMLLNHGANPNVLSPRGTTPLMFAARDNCPLLVKVLLEAGADPGIRTPDGMTALDVAIKWKSREPEKMLRACIGNAH